ncbi:hypothetical protein SAMN05216349_10691 [Oribacterium sp. KHPX15]|uniref:hypothetical protein n=1 Tax=Oribacterium sp. KHPX15 TaxID=1855342 RepID=UPI00089C7C2F|nr:hypothetical protein [Oribacterium sp. KHPX15]SEA19248.1 hypothetical protein SAMN05216349_10691 [Oribacterium sp. KHPX15]
MINPNTSNFIKSMNLKASTFNSPFDTKDITAKSVVNKKTSTSKRLIKLQALSMAFFMLLAFPAESLAYTIIGEGTIANTGMSEPTYAMNPNARGIDASTMTLQQIEDAKGAWLWADTTGNGLAERYYFLNSDSYLVNTVTPDGLTVDPLGRWTVNGHVMVRMSSDQNAVNLAKVRAAQLHGNSFTGIYSGPITFQNTKTKYYTMEITETSETVLNVLLLDDDGLDTITYTYVGKNIPHPGIIMFKSNQKDQESYLLFSDYNTIVYYNYDGSIAGQLSKIG